MVAPAWNAPQELEIITEPSGEDVERSSEERLREDEDDEEDEQGTDLGEDEELEPDSESLEYIYLKSRTSFWSSRRAVNAAGFFVLGVVSIVLVIVATAVEDDNHIHFHIGDILVVFALVVFLLLRVAGCLGPQRVAPACLFLAWAASLAISLGSSGRKQQMHGEAPESEGELCDEGPAALWIALVLCATLVLLGAERAEGPFASWQAFAGLGQVVSLQHLLAGLLVLRQDCTHSDAGTPAGVLLGMPPLWAATLQLSTLAGLLALALRAPRSQSAETLIHDYLAEVESARTPRTPFTGELTNKMERIVRDMEMEEIRCRRLLAELRPHVGPERGAGGQPYVWAALADHLVDVLSNSREKMSNRQENARDVNSQLLRAVREGGSIDSTQEVKLLSGWLQQDWTSEQQVDLQWCASKPLAEMVAEGPVGGASPHNSFARSSIQRHTNVLRTVVGACTELKVSQWSFDSLQVEEGRGNVLQLVGFELLRGFAMLPRPALSSFLGLLEQAYGKDLPYHSYIHAADVTNAFYFLVTKSRFWEAGEVKSTRRIAALLAALGHDIGHFGRNNLFLISTRHALAVTYNDRSVLENFHAASLIQLLDKDYGTIDGEEKVLGAMMAEQITSMRQLMIALILATDPAKHLEELSAFRVRLGGSDFDPLSNQSDQQQAMCMLMRAADIGHSAKEWALHEEWSSRVAREFHEQGDEEKQLGLTVSPLCNREGFVMASSQVGFLQFICVPTWKELSNFEDRVLILGAAKLDRSEISRSKPGAGERTSSRCATHGTTAVIDAASRGLSSSEEPKMGKTVSLNSSRSIQERAVRGDESDGFKRFIRSGHEQQHLYSAQGKLMRSSTGDKLLSMSSARSIGQRHSQGDPADAAPNVLPNPKKEKLGGVRVHPVVSLDSVRHTRTRTWQGGAQGHGYERHLTNTVLRLCEQNLQHWQSQVEQARRASVDEASNRSRPTPSAGGSELNDTINSSALMSRLVDVPNAPQGSTPPPMLDTVTLHTVTDSPERLASEDGLCS